MNRSGRYSSSSRGRGRQSWRKVTGDSSPSFQTPVQAASSNERASESLDKEPYSSRQVKGHNSDGVVSVKYENVTPAVRQGQQQGSSMFRGGGFLDRKPHTSWQVKGHSSDGVVSQDNDNVTPEGHQGHQQGSSSVIGESYFRGGRAKQWRASSKASSTADSSHDKKIGSSFVEAKVPINHDHSFMESVDHLADVSRLSLESAVESSHGSGRSSSKASSTADSSHDKKIGSAFVEAKVPINHDCSFMESVDHLADVSRLSLESAVVNSHGSGAKLLKSTENELDHENNEHSGCSTPVEIFDICPPKSGSVFTLKPSLLAANREKRNEKKNCQRIILRSGMVHLKGYFSTSEQAKILKICRNHGMDRAGFYQPGFREGGKLHLKMMCFGEFWDPETSKYGEVRPMDLVKPPSVPQEFLLLVDRVIKDSHSLIAEQTRVKNVEDVLPPVKPDICLVNYYAPSGRLGLHQDKDEGRESLGKGIPIVSFSIGDTAEFLYGDQEDVEKANTINLESGDVLIFGGKSRHIFHGVSRILQYTAPASLLQETNFRPGRLNLTFRQHL